MSFMMDALKDIQTLFKQEGISDTVVHLFREGIYQYYRENRRAFPWREEISEYGVFISEVMLQQTQAPRVVSKYLAFLQRFPNFDELARASVKDVLGLWQGLGYNRRALALKRAAEIIVAQHGGKLPRTIESLDELPTIGPATASSIVAFAFNAPTVFIETNVRSVYLHVFFFGVVGVTDKQLFELVEKTLDRTNPREWYYALMDYGTMLKKSGNPSRASKHYSKQSRFEGSQRQLRGAILRLLLQRSHSGSELEDLLNDSRIAGVLETLVKERLIVLKGEHYFIS